MLLECGCFESHTLLACVVQDVFDLGEPDFVVAMLGLCKFQVILLVRVLLFQVCKCQGQPKRSSSKVDTLLLGPVFPQFILCFMYLSDQTIQAV